MSKHLELQQINNTLYLFSTDSETEELTIYPTQANEDGTFTLNFSREPLSAEQKEVLLQDEVTTLISTSPSKESHSFFTQLLKGLNFI